MFGKVMSIPDELIVRYYKYAAHATDKAAKEMEAGLKDGSVHPRNAKVHTAQELVRLYHSQEEADGALAEFERMFVHKELPDEIEEKVLTFDKPIQQIADVLFVAGLAPSKKEAKRLIQQGGVYVDGERQDDVLKSLDFTEFRLLKVGKRKFMKIKIG
jgi:tyrosyl-tRNA synthetase